MTETEIAQVAVTKIADPATMELFNLLIIICVAGFFGGLVSAIFDLLSIVRPQDDENNTVCIECALFSGQKKNILYKLETISLRAIIGVAGSFGVVLFGLWSGKLTINQTVHDQLILICLCVMAGVISYKALPRLGNKLEEQLLAKKISKNEEKSNTAIKMSHNTADLSSALAFAVGTLQSGATYAPEVPQAISRLEKIKEIFKHDRTLHILLGRLYRKDCQYDKAILALRRFIENVTDPEWVVRADQIQNNSDIADAHYNIACYHALKLENELDPVEQKRYKREMFADLKIAFELNPENIIYAKGDSDLDQIVNEKEFIDLT